MRPLFFPIRDLKSVMDRKSLIMQEFGTRFEDSDPVYELMYFSELAFARRQEKKEAMKKGQLFL